MRYPGNLWRRWKWNEICRVEQIWKWEAELNWKGTKEGTNLLSSIFGLCYQLTCLHSQCLQSFMAARFGEDCLHFRAGSQREAATWFVDSEPDFYQLTQGCWFHTPQPYKKEFLTNHNVDEWWERDLYRDKTLCQPGHTLPDSKVPEAKANRGLSDNLKLEPNGVEGSHERDQVDTVWNSAK